MSMSQLLGALVAALAASLASAATAAAPTGEMDVVFPRNETYGVVSPFPIVFGFRNVPVVFASGGATVTWQVECLYQTFVGSASIDGYFLPKQHAEPYFVLNSTKTWYDAAPDYIKDKHGPLGEWRSSEDTCTLSWVYIFTDCKELSDGNWLLETGPQVKGNLTFSLRLGEKLPRDAIAAYDGCPVAGFALADNSSKACPDSFKLSSDVQPCALDVKPAMSSIVAAIVAPTTTFTALPTTTTTSLSQASSTDSSSQSTSTAGSGGSDKKSGTGSRSQSADAGLGLMLACWCASIIGGIL